MFSTIMTTLQGTGEVTVTTEGDGIEEPESAFTSRAFFFQPPAGGCPHKNRKETRGILFQTSYIQVIALLYLLRYKAYSWTG